MASGSLLAGPSIVAESWEKLLRFMRETGNGFGKKQFLAGCLGLLLLSLLRASAFLTFPGHCSSKHLGLDDA